MRSRVHPRHGDQLKLFHPSRRSPTWRAFPEKLRERTRRLLAQMLREQFARRVDGATVEEAGDE